MSAIALDALRHATDSLEYLTFLKNQTVFNFCAIPQAAAMAILALCSMSPQVFHRNVTVRKAEAARVSSQLALSLIPYANDDYSIASAPQTRVK